MRFKLNIYLSFLCISLSGHSAAGNPNAGKELSPLRVAFLEIVYLASIKLKDEPVSSDFLMKADDQRLEGFFDRRDHSLLVRPERVNVCSQIEELQNC